jgi:hypothetical protein
MISVKNIEIFFYNKNGGQKLLIGDYFFYKCWKFVPTLHDLYM